MVVAVAMAVMMMVVAAAATVIFCYGMRVSRSHRRVGRVGFQVIHGSGPFEKFGVHYHETDALSQSCV
jgi:hypothetical protein